MGYMLILTVFEAATGNSAVMTSFYFDICILQKCHYQTLSEHAVCCYITREFMWDFTQISHGLKDITTLHVNSDWLIQN